MYKYATSIRVDIINFHTIYNTEIFVITFQSREIYGIYEYLEKLI